jgi:hypothetical protein
VTAYWAAAQGLTAFLAAAHGLHGLHAFLAAHGLQGLQAAAFWAAHGLQGLHTFLAAHGLQGLQAAAFWAAHGLQGLHTFLAAHGVQAAATRTTASSFNPCHFCTASGLALAEVTLGAAGSCATVVAASAPPVASTIAIGNNAAVESRFCRFENM